MNKNSTNTVFLDKRFILDSIVKYRNAWCIIRVLDRIEISMVDVITVQNFFGVLAAKLVRFRPFSH